jgi:hypothetical protein
VQHGDEQHRDRLGEVDDLAESRAGQQVTRVPDISLDDRRAASRATPQRYSAALHSSEVLCLRALVCSLCANDGG